MLPFVCFVISFVIFVECISVLQHFLCHLMSVSAFCNISFVIWRVYQRFATFPSSFDECISVLHYFLCHLMSVWAWPHGGPILVSKPSLQTQVWENMFPHLINYQCPLYSSVNVLWRSRAGLGKAYIPLCPRCRFHYRKCVGAFACLCWRGASRQKRCFHHITIGIVK